MKRLVCLLSWVVISLALNAQTKGYIAPDDPNIRYVGRVSLATPGKAKFTFPGTQIRAVFEGTSLKMKMKPDGGYFMVEIDDFEPVKLHCGTADSIMTVASGLDSGEHNVCITLVTEGNGKKPEFRGFMLDNGCKLPKAPVLPKRKIEFIGNSITCGFGVEANSGKEKFSYATENQYLAYDGITARNLNAQCVAIARSGMGVYRNCGGNVAGDKVVMPKIYPYTLFGTSGELWDFKKYVPDVVCINLGTNDSSSSKYNHELFVNAYYDFIHTIRANYPDAKIVILSGTMIKGGSDRDIILRGLLDDICRKLNDEGDNNVSRFDLTPEDNTMGWGACFHPSARRQEYMAGELTDYLRKLMNWQ